MVKARGRLAQNQLLAAILVKVLAELEGLPAVKILRSFLHQMTKVLSPPQDTTEDDTTMEETQVTGIALQEAEEASDLDEMKTEWHRNELNSISRIVWRRRHDDVDEMKTK